MTFLYMIDFRPFLQWNKKNWILIFIEWRDFYENSNTEVFEMRWTRWILFHQTLTIKNVKCDSQSAKDGQLFSKYFMLRLLKLESIISHNFY